VQNWPTWLPILSPLNYHVCARKVYRREELLRRILNAARHMNNAAMLRKVSNSLISRLVKCGWRPVWTGAGAWADVTLQFTTSLSKHKMSLLPLHFQLMWSSRLNNQWYVHDISYCKVLLESESYSTDLQFWDTLWSIDGRRTSMNVELRWVSLHVDSDSEV
jgi:hypothetical protein